MIIGRDGPLAVLTGAVDRLRQGRGGFVLVTGEAGIGERDALLGELRPAFGLGGRPRRLRDEGERARKTVTARIRDTLRRLDARHPPLAGHLRGTVSTGAYCCYQPPVTVH